MSLLNDAIKSQESLRLHLSYTLQLRYNQNILLPSSQQTLSRLSFQAVEISPGGTVLKFVYSTNEKFEVLYLMTLSAAMIMQNR